MAARKKQIYSVHPGVAMAQNVVANMKENTGRTLDDWLAFVKASACKTMVPLYRNHVFAQLKPSTSSRLDLGLALGATKAPARLIDTGGFAKKDRITHRIPITSTSDIDDDVKTWLRTAYEMD